MAAPELLAYLRGLRVRFAEVTRGGALHLLTPGAGARTLCGRVAARLVDPTERDPCGTCRRVLRSRLHDAP